MPTYEYRCDACGHTFEKEQRMVDDPIKTCPKCKKPKARRQISGGNFILKGGGWYADLYHKPAGKKASPEGESGSSSETKSDAKAETKTESKPEAKSEPKTDSGSSKKAKKKD